MLYSVCFGTVFLRHQELLYVVVCTELQVSTRVNCVVAIIVVPFMTYNKHSYIRHVRYV